MWDQVEKSRKFQGVGGVTCGPLEWKIQCGGASNWKKPSVGEVWIFSGTTHCKISSFDPYRFFFLKNLVDTATDTSPEDTLPTSRMHITELICDMKIIDLIR